MQNQPLAERRFGRYLRKIRVERKLSLDSVEELTVGYPERITKSHLSRIENGQASPTFPRMFALSQIYGVPISNLAERFETDLQSQALPDACAEQSDAAILEESKRLRDSGRYSQALVRYQLLLDRGEVKGDPDPSARIDLELERINCLVHLSKHASAKDSCEDLLSLEHLTPRQRVTTFYQFTVCCYRLSKFSVALIAIEHAERELAAIPTTSPLHAHLNVIKGILTALTGRTEAAIEAFSRALQRFEELGDVFEACRARLNLATAQMDSGRSNEARRQLTKVIEQARIRGYERQLALAISALAVLAYNNEEIDACESHCLKSNVIARPREYHSVVFRNCYYLWKIANLKKDKAGVRANERTLKAYLIHVEDFLPEAVAFKEYLAGGAPC